ncbi:MAG TPA: hypothetical protein VFK82_02545 [Burkholderiaceae bacterium]|nr:hypothetical protein [Burkholderiaceae bacterium]
MNTQPTAGDSAATEPAAANDKDLGAKLERIAPAAKSALQAEAPVKAEKTVKRAVKKAAKQLAKPAAKKPAAKVAKPAAEPAAKKTSAKPAAKKAAKPAAPAKSAPKPAAKPAAANKPAAKKPAAKKPAAKKTAAAKRPAKPVVQPSALAKALASAEQAIEKRVKIVRDSFTMPKPDFELIDRLKARAIKLGRPVKKSELLRAGLHALNNLREDMLKTALQALPVLKTGRPKKR